MAFLVGVIFKAFSKNTNIIIRGLIAGLVAEALMLAGYLVYESFLYGFKTALLSVPFNGIQGVIGMVLGAELINVISETKFLK